MPLRWLPIFAVLLSFRLMAIENCAEELEPTEPSIPIAPRHWPGGLGSAWVETKFGVYEDGTAGEVDVIGFSSKLFIGSALNATENMRFSPVAMRCSSTTRFTYQNEKGAT